MVKGPSCLICLKSGRGLNGVKVEGVSMSKGSRGIKGSSVSYGYKSIKGTFQ